jgi:outer membrane protein assembly factor BamB
MKRLFLFLFFLFFQNMILGNENTHEIKELWHFQGENEDSSYLVNSNLLSSNGNSIFFVNNHRFLRSLKKNNGKEQWKQEINGLSSIEADHKKIIVINHEGEQLNQWLLSCKKGKEITPPEKKIDLPCLSKTRKGIAVNSQENLSFFKKIEAKILINFPGNYPALFSQVLEHKGHLYFHDGYSLYAYSLSKKKLRWIIRGKNCPEGYATGGVIKEYKTFKNNNAPMQGGGISIVETVPVWKKILLNPDNSEKKHSLNGILKPKGLQLRQEVLVVQQEDISPRTLGIDIKSGKILWQKENMGSLLPGKSDVKSPIYCLQKNNDGTGQVQVVNPQTGDILEEILSFDNPLQQPLIVFQNEGLLYVIDKGLNLTLFKSSMKNKTLLVHQIMENYGEIINLSCLLEKDKLFILANGRLTALKISKITTSPKNPS